MKSEGPSGVGNLAPDLESSVYSIEIQSMLSEPALLCPSLPDCPLWVRSDLGPRLECLEGIPQRHLPGLQISLGEPKLPVGPAFPWDSRNGRAVRPLKALSHFFFE